MTNIQANKQANPSKETEAAANKPAEGKTVESAEGRATSFRAVEGGGNVRDGGMLLVQAYAIIWLLIMFLVWRTMRRQVDLDARIEALRGLVAKHPGVDPQEGPLSGDDD